MELILRWPTLILFSDRNVKKTGQLVVNLLGFLQEVCGDGAEDSFHHSKVLLTVMGLKEKTI